MRSNVGPWLREHAESPFDHVWGHGGEVAITADFRLPCEAGHAGRFEYCRPDIR
jgi:hypothetical protein